MSRGIEDCQAYIKPWVNVKDLDEKAMSSCDCNPENPSQCTDLDIKTVEGKLSCEASEDCKKGIQAIGDMWDVDAIKPKSNYHNCFAAFEAIEVMNDLCINQ